MQVYLKLLGLENAKLIEQFNGETHTADIKFDVDLFDNRIASEIFKFANKFEEILRDPTARSNYIKGRG